MDLLNVALNPNAPPSKGKAKSQTTTLEAATDSTRGTQWLLLVRPQGVMEVYLTPLSPQQLYLISFVIDMGSPQIISSILNVIPNATSKCINRFLRTTSKVVTRRAATATTTL